jgi:hypothetical protein
MTRAMTKTATRTILAIALALTPAALTGTASSHPATHTTVATHQTAKPNDWWW